MGKYAKVILTKHDLIGIRLILNRIAPSHRKGFILWGLEQGFLRGLKGSSYKKAEII